MSDRVAISEPFVDHQQRSYGLSVGDPVGVRLPTGEIDIDVVGSVLAVMRGIGMVDVQFMHGVERLHAGDVVKVLKPTTSIPAQDYEPTLIAEEGNTLKSAALVVAKVHISRKH